MINGKEVKDIIKELASPMPKGSVKIRDFDGRPYIPVEAMIKRLNDVVGVENYSDTYDIKEIKAGDTLGYMAICTLRIYDEDRIPVIEKSMAGGSVISFPYDKETKRRLTETTSLPNDVTTACQDAFKKVLSKRLGIGETDLEQAAKGEEWSVELTSSFREYNQSFYGDGIFEGRNIKLALFKNDVTGCGTPVDAIKTIGKGSFILVRGKIGQDKKGDEQIIIKSLVISSRSSSASPLQISVKTAGEAVESDGGYVIPVSDASGKRYSLLFKGRPLESLKEKGYLKSLLANAAKGVILNIKAIPNTNGDTLLYME